MLSIVFQVIGMATVGIAVMLAILSYIGAVVMSAELDDYGIGFGMGWSLEDEDDRYP